MASTQTPETDQEQSAEVFDSDTVELSIDELPLGEEILFPVYDESRLLLLAEGTVLSEPLIDRLKERGIRKVYLSQACLKRAGDAVTEEEEAPPEVEEADAAAAPEPQPSMPSSPDESVGHDIASRFNGQVDPRLMGIQNSLPAFRDDLAYHRLKPYVPGCREQFLQLHQEAVEEVNTLMHAALKGRQIEAKAIFELAVRFQKLFCKDLDCVLAATLEVEEIGDVALHCVQQAIVAMAIGVEMGFNEQNVLNVGVCGLVNDWGMLKVPAEYRNAKRPLTSAEFEKIQEHPLYTVELLRRVKNLPLFVSLVCYQVHEKPNGHGYPVGREEDEIHRFAKILSVADSYLALVSPRPYRMAVMPYAAMECLLRQASLKAYFPEVVRALLHVVSLFPIGSYATLSDGSLARVHRRNGKKYMTPLVQVVQDHRGCRIDLTDEKSIIDLTTEDGIDIDEAVMTPGRKQIALSPAVIQQRRR